jgi:hypothetical protein
MSIRNRTWKTAKGEAKEAWVVDYVDQHGKRRLKTFRLQREAKAFAAAGNQSSCGPSAGPLAAPDPHRDLGGRGFGSGGGARTPDTRIMIPL